MSCGIQIPDEFKQNAVALIVVPGYAVSEDVERLAVGPKSLGTWKARVSMPQRERAEAWALAAETKWLRREKARDTEERNILKSAG